MSETAGRETRGFQTEVRRLLDLMIHSLYSNKEIFLRELVSNASDAADKLRFEALSNEALYEGDGDLAIRVDLDPEARTITVSDNGVGMSHEEAVANLGTIARSGTREFFESLTGDQAKDALLIGQFGVGFYSSFIVADRVTVTTRRAGLGPESGVRWESTGEGEYTIERLEVARRGTEVVLHLRAGEDDLLDGHRLRAIIHRYSDHIPQPIKMRAESGDGDEVVNRATAMWTRPRQEITEQEYQEFYKHVAHDFEDPLAWVHSRVEGNLEYTSLLYVPQHAPFDLWDRNVRRGVHLYVRRVFIMDDAEQLMPPYLRFVRGVIDSADLPLNISRELLQHNRQIESIRAGSVKRVLDLLAGIAKDEPDKYATFWEQFGRVLKEGVIEDAKNREAIAGLLRFASTHGDDEHRTSLDEYVERMRPGQSCIYYVAADNLATARKSPHLEIFRARGVEVLLLTDEIDEWVVNHLREYRDKPLQSVARGELDLDAVGGDAGEAQAKTDDDHAVLLDRFRDALGDRVAAVRVTRRLTTSPACVVAGEHELGRHMERILRAAGQSVEASRPILEVNPDHPVVQRFAEEADAGRRDDLAHIVLDQALLAEGGKPEDPAEYVRRVNDLLIALAGATPAPKRSGKGARKGGGRRKAGDDAD